MPASPDKFVPLAIIRHAHGVRGEVKIASLTTPADSFFSYALHDEAGALFKLTRTGTQPDIFLCRIEGITDRTQAEALKGKKIGVMHSALSANDENALYAEDMIGVTVIDEKGSTIGTIRDITNYGASDIVVIDTEDGELMLPFAEQFFPQDAEDGTLLCLLPDMISGRPE